MWLVSYCDLTYSSNSYLILALQVKDDWFNFFCNPGILADTAHTYSTAFVNNRVTETMLPRLNHQYLTELGITIFGDVLSILAHTTSDPVPTTATLNTTPPPPKLTKAKPPQITCEITHSQFWKFKIDWDLFKRITAILFDQITAQLYNICDDSVQNSIINTITDVFQQDESSLLQLIENIVTKYSNPTVHQMHFGNLAQTITESIQAYLVRLKSAALDCEFSCPDCHYDLVPINWKDQFISGSFNTILQTEILAKDGHLTTFEEIVEHAEAFETAVHIQTKQNTKSINFKHL